MVASGSVEGFKLDFGMEPVVVQSMAATGWFNLKYLARGLLLE